MADDNHEDTSSKSSKSLWSGMKRTLKRKGSATNLQTIKKEPLSPQPEAAAERKAFAGRGRSVSSFTVNDAQDFIKSQPDIFLPKARKKPQFGMHPTTLLEGFPDEPVPAIIVACVEVLEKDLMKEGIFRIPGRMTDILEMKISFEQGKGLGVEVPDTYAVAGLLAQFFRELPEPLMTYDLYNNWIAATRVEPEQVAPCLVDLVGQLPIANYNLLKYFIEFLGKVAKHGGANRMGVRNLALVFGASLLNPPDIEQYDLNNIKAQCEVVEQLISNYDFIFEGTEGKNFSGSNRTEKSVATIPAGSPQGSTPDISTRKKRSILDRAQFTNSTRLSSSLGEVKTKPKLVSNLSMSSNAVHVSKRQTKIEKKKKKRKTEKE